MFTQKFVSSLNVHTYNSLIILSLQISLSLVDHTLFHCLPTPTLPATVMQAQLDIMEMENMKKYQKHMDDMMRDRPKLYGLIMEHKVQGCHQNRSCL
jgi:hypothetical protein